MQGIYKSFGPVEALKDVDFSVSPGEIHGLLGENGAGKTTLMNILSGALPPDKGRIIIDGREIEGMTPRKSNEMGIRFIHQELSLCNDLCVYQNMFLGSEERKHGLVDREKERKMCQEVLDLLHLDISPDALTGDLETAQKQLVEIGRALLFESEIIIMDEPTTALNAEEIENLFTIMRELQAKGVSFIYISHKMPEIFSICSRYTVLRDGCFIETGNLCDIDQKRATELLIGKSFVDDIVKDRYPKDPSQEVVIEVKDLSGETFHSVSFSVTKGEIVVITGLQGSGTDELATALFGATAHTSGTVSVAGKEGIRSIHSAMRCGIGMIPRNRKERGIIPDLSIEKNNSIAYFTALHRRPFISAREESDRFLSSQKMMDIKVGSPSDPITSLSGGNQQKVILGRWLSTDADVYVLDNPTQGIDVGAKFSIYSLINRIASEGKTIIAFTNEYPEMLQIADRVLVMYKGSIVKELRRTELTERAVMAYSTGSGV